ncbi:MAG: oligopeptidase A [Legionellales bacterium]|nr:oligopeptidase A [Legionellales bacterium]|tara:strand:+ start:24290 stop:26308 length:2019 start_codon:yes stop_codon:yes gene_type:complete
MTNPLLANTPLPAFSAIKPELIEPALDMVLHDNRQRLVELLQQDRFTWENLILPLEAMEDRLSNLWSPVRHMNATVNTPELREAHNNCIEKLSAYGTELSQNTELFNAYRALAESEDAANYTAAQKKVLDDALRDFHLAGVDLPDTKKQRFAEISQRLSLLSTRFEENVMDATDGWSKHITDESLLAGLPEHVVTAAKAEADKRKLDGWVFTLEIPSYLPIMQYADNRELREEMYHAHVTRASDQGPNAGKWDNTPIMEEIVKLRHELATLVGFANYAEYSVATKMAESPEKVMTFLEDLVAKSKPQAEDEFAELEAFAGMTLQPWDVAYYSEKLRLDKHNFSEEELRPYYPEDKVVEGLFTIVNKLYGIQIAEEDDFDKWHDDVRFFSIYDTNKQLRGQFYLDLYARANKRGGAWMDECRCRCLHDGVVQIPVAYLTCNFAGPTGNKPALFNQEEVLTLFHEFGHGLHHMLTRIDHLDISGINGVAWDAVELPSQFMENWCWEKDALALFSGHYETGEAIPDELFERMLAAKNFQSAMTMVRQLEFSLFDFKLHWLFDPSRGAHIQETLDEVRDAVSVMLHADYNRFQHGFSHIFGGGYAAGYYSYKWAEVLSSDAYSKFEEHGIFDRKTGEEFLHNILEQGGSADAMDLFVAFRGREPDIQALLRHNGIN